MVRQTPPRPLSLCQPSCAEGGAGAQHPGRSRHAAHLPCFGKPRGCEVPSPWRRSKGMYAALCRAEISSFTEEIPLDGSPGCCREDAKGPGEGMVVTRCGFRRRCILERLTPEGSTPTGSHPPLPALPAPLPVPVPAGQLAGLNRAPESPEMRGGSPRCPSAPGWAGRCCHTSAH